MHVLMATPALSRDMGGGDHYPWSLALALLERAVQVTIVTSLAEAEADFWRGRPGEPTRAQPAGGLTIARVPLRPFPGGRPALHTWRRAMALLALLPGLSAAPLARMARRLPGLIDYEMALAAHIDDADLVHGFNLSWEYALLAAAAAAQRRRIPLVITPYAHLDGGRASRNLTMPHQLNLLKSAAGVQALSAVEKTHLAAHGVAADRIQVVGGGYDVPAAAPGAPLMTEPYAFFLGRTSADKGAHHAAAAIAHLAAQGRGLHLVLAGSRLPEFDRELARLPAAARALIHPLGRVDEAAKQVLLRDALMLLLPSRSDAFGIVILEAWARQKPVVGARAGGIPGVVADGETGMLVPYGDVPALAAAIARLQDDDELRRRLGQAGLARLRATYTWSAVAERVHAGYVQALRGAGPNSLASDFLTTPRNYPRK